MTYGLWNSNFQFRPEQGFDGPSIDSLGPSSPVPKSERTADCSACGIIHRNIHNLQTSCPVDHSRHSLLSVSTIATISCFLRHASHSLVRYKAVLSQKQYRRPYDGSYTCNHFSLIWENPSCTQVGRFNGLFLELCPFPVYCMTVCNLAVCSRSLAQFSDTIMPRKRALPHPHPLPQWHFSGLPLCLLFSC